MSTSILTGWSRNTGRRAATATAVALVGTLTCCLVSTRGEAAPAPSGSAAIPAKAFTDYTGVTAHTVTVANISTQSAGLFAGAAVGAQAYADYVNASGGVNGRRLVVQSFDDRFTGTANKQLTEAAVQNDFATVGGFSLEDGFGGTVLRANPGMPDISESLDPATAALPNSFSPSPLAAGWPMGPLVYFKKRFPDAVLRTATITADLPSTVTAWNHEKATMVHLGYHVLYDPSLPASSTDFTQNVIAMKNLGVKILFLEQSPESYASATIKDLDQQNFHPILVLGAPPYSESLVANSGGPAAVNGAYLEQAAALYLGEDAAAIPSVHTFLSWVQKASPGFHTDEFTLFGWLSASLFTQALRSAGTHPSRGSLLEALHRITAFTGNNLIPASNPAKKVPISCYLIGRIEHGAFQRQDDPPIAGPTHGYRCDQPFYYPK